MTVPTPVDAENRPDLGAVLGARGSVGGDRPGAPSDDHLRKHGLSGVTEEICGPELEESRD